MSDIVGPPSKITKTGESALLNTSPPVNSADEGQEEWLSEDILADDDYNPVENEQSNLNFDNTCDEIEMMDETETELGNTSTDTIPKEDIEDTLNNLEITSQEKSLSTGLENVMNHKTKLNSDPYKNQEKTSNAELKNDDGNSTDDLLRVLGDYDVEDTKQKVMVKKKPSKASREPSSDEDDEITEQRQRVTRLRVTQTTTVKKIPTKAEPEETDGDVSTDEGETVKKMFVGKLTKLDTQSNKITNKENHTRSQYIASSKQKMNRVTDNSVVRHSPKRQSTSSPSQQSQPKSQSIPVARKKTTTKNYVNQQKRTTLKVEFKDVQSKEIPKKMTRISKLDRLKLNTNPLHKADVRKESPPSIKKVIKVPDTYSPKHTNSTSKMQQKTKQSMKTNDRLSEIINEREFMEDKMDLDLKELEDDSSDKPDTDKKQRIMKPEQMDEEIPSDDDSVSGDGSVSDDFPTSDLEDDLEDWFNLDIRSEKAGDYIPLLGTKAYELLTQEKHRVESRLETLKQSLSALGESGRNQSEKIDRATLSIAELDTLLAVA